MKLVEAPTFFSGERPAGVPADSARPDYDALVAKTAGINGGRYPLDIIAPLLARENTRLGASPLTLDAIASINQDTVFVVAGQQAGLFGGPLYTLYKAMHAIRLAERLKQSTGKNVLPLFWIASDDHDFEEVASYALRSEDGEERTVKYSQESWRHGTPVGEIVLNSTIMNMVAAFRRSLPPGDDGARYGAFVGKAWTPGVKWADAFAQQLLGLFDRYGLIVFDPRWAGVKALFRDIYLTEISDPLASVHLVNRAANFLERSLPKYRALRKPEGSTNIFLEIDGARYPLRYKEGVFFAREKRFSPKDIQSIINTELNRLSPAAALRPVCQDAIFPVAAQIAGPGECRYLSQLDSIYDLFGIDRSTPWPRASFTIIDARVLRAAEKENVALTDLFRGFDTIKNAILKQSFPKHIEDDFDALEKSVVDGFARLAKSIVSLDSTLVNTVKKDVGRVLHITEGLRERALRAHKASTGVTDRRINAAFHFLLPGGKAQERYFGLDAIIATLSGGGFDRLLEATSPDEENHRIVLPD